MKRFGKTFFAFVLVLAVALTTTIGTLPAKAVSEPALVCTDAVWDENGDRYAPDVETAVKYTSVTNDIQSAVERIFYYVDENGNYTLLDASQLVVENEDIVQLQPNEGDISYIIMINPKDFGETKISYTDDEGQVYSVDVTITLPNVAFYTTPAASTDTYINLIWLSEDTHTVYFVLNNAWKLFALSTREDYGDSITIEIDESGTFATIQIDPSLEDQDVLFDYTVEDPNTGFMENIIYLTVNKLQDPVYYEYEEWFFTIGDQGSVYEEIHYYDEYDNEKEARVTDVQVSNDNVLLQKVEDEDGYYWILKGEKKGTTDVTITHTDPDDPQNTMTYTFTITVVDKYIYTESYVVGNVDHDAVPGDTLERHVRTYLVCYDEEADEFTEIDVTDQATYVWDVQYHDTSENTKAEYNDHVISITFAEDEEKWASVDYDCTVTYEVDGEEFIQEDNFTVSVTDAYYYVIAKELSDDFSYGDKEEITPTVYKISYDYDTREKSESQVTENLNLVFYNIIEDSGFQISCGDEPIYNFETVSYNADDKYYLTRGSIYEERDQYIWVDIYLGDPAFGKYLGYCSWKVCETDYLYGQVVLEADEGTTLVNEDGEPLENELMRLEGKEGYWYPLGWKLFFDIQVDDGYELMYNTWESDQSGGGLNYEPEWDLYYGEVEEGVNTIITYAMPKVMRLSGTDRFATGTQISGEFVGDGEAEAIVIVDGLTFPDALSAVPFAVQECAPILMSHGKEGELRESVLAEIERIDPDHNAAVYLIGGDNAVSPKIQNKLESLGYASSDIERIAGATRFETAIEIAERVPEASTVYIADGYNYPDALGIGSAAALNNGVILFTEKDALTDSTKEYLGSRTFENVIILGGPAAVSENVEAELEAMFPDQVERIYGQGRVETSVEIAEEYFATADTVVIATGWNFADALAGGPLATYLTAPVLLLNGEGTEIPEDVAQYIEDCGARFITVLGGSNAVNDALYEELWELID